MGPNSELRDVIAIMQTSRVLRVKLPNGLEVELSPLAFALPGDVQSQQAAPVGVEHGGEPTDEQMLMWSAPGALPKAEQAETVDRG